MLTCINPDINNYFPLYQCRRIINQHITINVVLQNKKGTEKKISLMLYFSPPGQVFKKTVNKQNKIDPADTKPTESIQFTLT